MPLITIWRILVVCIEHNYFLGISRIGIDGMYVQFPKSLCEISMLHRSERLILKKQNLMLDKMCRNFIPQVIR